MVNKKTTVQLLPEMEKQLKHLETISGKSRSFIFQEALLKLFKELENTPEVNLKKKGKEKELTIKLPQDWVNHLLYLEQTTNQNKDYYVKEALHRYLESIHELQIALKSSKSNSKIYNSEEANKRLEKLKVKSV